MNNSKISFNNQIVMIGFGSIGRAVLPVLFQRFDIKPSQITIMAADDEGAKIAQKYGVTFELNTITSNNYIEILSPRLNQNDFLLYLAYDISSADLIALCDQKGALYIDTSTEPWIEDYDSDEFPMATKTNYMIRENALAKIKGKVKKTALLTHGANPGLVSHFVKQALLNMAADTNLDINKPTSSNDWAHLANRLGIKIIHIAERDTQVSSRPKVPGEFVNTWSIEGLIDEGLQPAELGWGSHEKHWPKEGHKHQVGCGSAIYLARSGAGVRVRSWAPSLGAYHGFMITHPEVTSISNYLTLKQDTDVFYRPTVHYAYCPCPDAVLSLFELNSNEWQPQKNQRLIFNEIIDGVDELGVLLMGNAKGAYWYGSHLSIHEAREIAPHNNATSLQVVAGVVSGMIWALEHPNEGLIEPEDIDHEYILNLASPYLGQVKGFYTNWTPLQGRQALFEEELDLTDPWQFKNIRVQ